MENSNALGTEKISKLLIKQSVPAGIGILVMSIYMIIDTIFVGRWVGAMGIAAVTVVMPIVFLIASIGMSIGIGGASIISRALGAGRVEHAKRTFGNQVSLTIVIAGIVVLCGFLIQEPILKLFGGQGTILPYAKEFFSIVLLGIPFLAFAMMSNNVIRSEGKPKIAMMIMLIPAVLNTVLDAVFIYGLEMGIAGAAWATTISYMASAGYGLYYFLSGKSELSISPKYFSLQADVVKEIGALGGISLARQGTISILIIILNNGLLTYGGEEYVAVYGIINRVMMFSLFPVMGVTQGFIPIAGYNYGARKYDRVKKVIRTAIISGTLIALTIYAAILFFSTDIVGIFTKEEFLLQETPKALTISFLATPVILLQLVSSAYFQAMGKAVPALLLTLTKQGFFLIPLVFILPKFYGLTGIWVAFPIADVLSAAVCFTFLTKELRREKYNASTQKEELQKVKEEVATLSS